MDMYDFHENLRCCSILVVKQLSKVRMRVNKMIEVY